MKNKLFYVEYSIRILDGINEYSGYMYGKNDIEIKQEINQIAFDLKSDEHFIDVVDEVNLK